MAGIKNNVQFEQQVIVDYQGSFEDANKNTWRVNVIGHEDLVKEFIEEQAFLVEAKPLTKEEANSLQDEILIEKGQLDELRKENPPLPEEQLPVLEVTFSLLQLAFNPPYLVNFQIDPRIDASTSPRCYRFCLKGRDVTSNVRYTANLGTVSARLSGANGSDYDGPSAQGAVIVSPATRESCWSATVYYGTGTPTFNLRGDLVVN